VLLHIVDRLLAQAGVEDGLVDVGLQVDVALALVPPEADEVAVVGAVAVRVRHGDAEAGREAGGLLEGGEVAAHPGSDHHQRGEQDGFHDRQCRCAGPAGPCS